MRNGGHPSYTYTNTAAFAPAQTTVVGHTHTHNEVPPKMGQALTLTAPSLLLSTGRPVGTG